MVGKRVLPSDRSLILWHNFCKGHGVEGLDLLEIPCWSGMPHQGLLHSWRRKVLLLQSQNSKGKKHKSTYRLTGFKDNEVLQLTFFFFLSWEDGELGQWVKAHVTMYDDMTLVLRTHMVGENCPLTFTYTLWYAPPIHVEINKQINKYWGYWTAQISKQYIEYIKASSW